MSDNGSSFFSGAKDVGLDLRQPPPDLGNQIVTVESVRFHQGISGPGVIVEIVQENGDHRGWRIQLGGKFPTYGQRDMKILTAALEGFGLDDPRAAAIGQLEISWYLEAANPARGKRIMLDTINGSKVDPKTGQPYRTIRPFAVGTSTATPSAPAAPAAPPAPIKRGPPAGWLENPNAPGWFYNPADTSAAQVQA